MTWVWFRGFCLERGNDFINFCLKQGLPMYSMLKLETASSKSILALKRVLMLG